MQSGGGARRAGGKQWRKCFNNCWPGTVNTGKSSTVTWRTDKRWPRRGEAITGSNTERWEYVFWGTLHNKPFFRSFQKGQIVVQKLFHFTSNKVFQSYLYSCLWNWRKTCQWMQQCSTSALRYPYFKREKWPKNCLLSLWTFIHVAAVRFPQSKIP